MNLSKKVITFTAGAIAGIFVARYISKKKEEASRHSKENYEEVKKTAEEMETWDDIRKRRKAEENERKENPIDSDSNLVKEHTKYTTDKEERVKYNEFYDSTEDEAEKKEEKPKSIFEPLQKTYVINSMMFGLSVSNTETIYWFSNGVVVNSEDESRAYSEDELREMFGYIEIEQSIGAFNELYIRNEKLSCDYRIIFKDYPQTID